MAMAGVPVTKTAITICPMEWAMAPAQPATQSWFLVKTRRSATVTTMALHYAYRIKEDVVVEAVKYGLLDWNAKEEPKGILYDTTALFYIDCLIDRIAAMKLSDPEGALKALLGTEK